MSVKAGVERESVGAWEREGAGKRESGSVGEWESARDRTREGIEDEDDGERCASIGPRSRKPDRAGRIPALLITED